MNRADFRHGRSPEILSDLPSGCALAIVTDPPYGTGRGDAIYGRRRDGKANTIANDADLSELRAVAPTLARLLAATGIAWVFCAPQLRSQVEAIIADGGLVPLHSAPWDKGAPGISYTVRYAYEDAVIAAHDGSDPWVMRDPLIVPLRHSKVLNPRHPNEKPVPLLRQIIRWALPDGGLVVDPFAGIASCGVAALLEGCSYVGAEFDEQWIGIGQERLRHVIDTESDLPLFQSIEAFMPPNQEDTDRLVYEHVKSEASRNGATVRGNLRKIGAATGVKPGTVWSSLQRLATAGKLSKAGVDGRSTLWRLAGNDTASDTENGPDADV